MAKKPKDVEALTHDEARRRNIPTAELQPMMSPEDLDPREVRYQRNHDLDPQLMWRGKDEQDWSDLVVNAPPLFIQEKVHPKVLIDDLIRQSKEARKDDDQDDTPDLFADFNGIDPEARAEFYEHDQNWTNRMILGDSLQVMASLAEKEGLRGKVQCIYFDPPYGIKFNSNFQWSTTSRLVDDKKAEHITREPEQVKAFRDTWRYGTHSYLTYIRDRLSVCRDLLADSGSLFVQISDENVHRVRTILDELFGPDNHICTISIQKTGSVTGGYIQSNVDYVIWYGKSKEKLKFRALFKTRDGKPDAQTLRMNKLKRDDFSAYPLTSDGYRETTTTTFTFQGMKFHPGQSRHWGVINDELERVAKSGRIVKQDTMIRMKYFWDDYPVIRLGSSWSDVGGATGKVYIVQTATKVIERLVLLCSDPGDLILDPTCGSGTTAYVAEQWGRRWITIDTSRVALALARTRIMGARYPYYILADSREGQLQEAKISKTPAPEKPTHGDIRQGFVYKRVPHVTLKSIGINTEIDLIWDRFQTVMEPLRQEMNACLSKSWSEWDIPTTAEVTWPANGKSAHKKWWEARLKRQEEMDASIANRADQEYLYDVPYVDNSRIRVAGPFTVESLSPHRVLAVDENDELIHEVEAAEGKRKGPVWSGDGADFATMVIETLKTAGVQQPHKEDRITFTSISPWPGRFIGAEGRFLEGEAEKKAAILIGPEFGTVSRPDLVAAVREAADGGFDVLIACAFNFDAHSSEFGGIGRIPVLKARMNPDLHMSDELKTTKSGNLFVVFGEPDIDIQDAGDNRIRVKINGVDVFHPATGEIESGGPENIACWFIDTDYNEESFFVRHAYFLGASDPYKALKTTLKAEIDEDAWASLYSDTSRPFERPSTGRIAVKVINHLGDEVMKVFGV
ncbi:MAG: site-specific DNA-methyltransferase [Thalassobaculum sp.]